MAQSFDGYQQAAHSTAQFGDYVPAFVYLALGLAGESGEVVEKIKKIVRNKNGQINNDDKEEIKKELGDVLWYISQLSLELGIPLSEVAEANIKKLFDRKERNVITSQGDNR